MSYQKPTFFPRRNLRRRFNFYFGRDCFTQSKEGPAGALHFRTDSRRLRLSHLGAYGLYMSQSLSHLTIKKLSCFFFPPSPSRADMPGCREATAAGAACWNRNQVPQLRSCPPAHIPGGTRHKHFLPVLLFAVASVYLSVFLKQQRQHLIFPGRFPGPVQRLRSGDFSLRAVCWHLLYRLRAEQENFAENSRNRRSA